MHRLAWLVAEGVDPGRILLLTFTRRAAAEMLRRAEILLHRLGQPGTARVWGGTYHAIATRLLHRYGKTIGLRAVHGSRSRRLGRPDQCRTHRAEPGQDRQAVPQEGHVHGHLQPLRQCPREARRRVGQSFSLVPAMAGRVEVGFSTATSTAKRRPACWTTTTCCSTAAGGNALCWNGARERASRDAVRKLFDCVLVDEYQDTNTLQAEILYRLSPEGKGLTVVGDDAQSIYAFRAATVRNILDFPKHYPAPPSSRWNKTTAARSRSWRRPIA